YVSGFNLAASIPSDATILGLQLLINATCNQNTMRVNIGTNYSPDNTWFDFIGGTAGPTGPFIFGTPGVGQDFIENWSTGLTADLLRNPDFSVMFQFFGGPGTGDTYLTVKNIK